MIKFHNIIWKMTKKYYLSILSPRIHKIIHIVLMVLFIPFHLVFLALFIAYEIIFCIMMFIRVPADFIMETINEQSTMSPAAQFVVHMIAYPIKAFFDLITGVQMIGLSVLFIFVAIIGFFGSLGALGFNPILMHQTASMADGEGKV